MFVEIVFVTSIISFYVTAESSAILSKYLPFLQVQLVRFSIWAFFAQMKFSEIFALALAFIVIPLLIWLYFLPSNLLLDSHDTCFGNVFDKPILVTISKTFKFMSFVLFTTHILLD